MTLIDVGVIVMLGIGTVSAFACLRRRQAKKWFEQRKGKVDWK